MQKRMAATLQRLAEQVFIRQQTLGGRLTMTYYGGRQMAASFRTVRGNTIRIAEEIPEARYDFKATPDTRTVAQTLVHIAFGPSFQLHLHQHSLEDVAKVNFAELMAKVGAEEAKPRNKSQILALLKAEGEAFASFLEGLPDSFLAEQVTMPPGAEPPIKSRFELLLSPKEHEMHHRGQLMVLQRLLGLTPHLTRQRQERFAAQRAGQ
jgi:uncharacterized damage-inducible protein DinB